MEDQELGALLQYWRQLKRRTVRDLAHAVNVHHTTLSRYLSGERRLNLDLAKRFDEELDTGGVFAKAVYEQLSAASGPSPQRVPMQLPSVGRHFVGRHPEWQRLDRYFSHDGGIVVIDGPPGVGKTHMMNAMGWEILRRHSDLRVLYVTTLQFVQQFTAASKNKKVPDFIKYYQQIDVLFYCL